MSTGPTTLPASGDSAIEPARRRLPRLRDARIRSKLALILVVPVAAVHRAGHGPARLGRRGRLRRHPGPVADRALRRRLRAHPGPAQGTDGRGRLPGRAAAARPTPTTCGSAQHRRSGSTAYRGRARPDRRRAGRRAGPAGRPSTTTWRRWTAPGRRCWTAGRWRSPRRCCATASSSPTWSRYGDGARPSCPATSAWRTARRAVAAFARAKAAVAEEEAVAFTALAAGRLDEEQFSSFVATLTSQQEALRRLLRWPPTRRSAPWSTAPSPATRSASPTGSPPTSPARSGSARWSPRRTPPPPSARSTT